MRMVKFKKIIIALISMLGCFTLISCGTNKNVKKEAEKIVKAVEENDMDTLEKIIMGTSWEDIDLDEEISDFFMESYSNENDGIISKIIARDSIEIKKITSDSITYEITSPELSSIFQDIMQDTNIQVENLEEYIYSYVEEAAVQKLEVKIAYTYENNMFKADYATDDFVSAITGNVINSYQKLIYKMIEEFNQEAVR
jgi:hypothetical protein